MPSYSYKAFDSEGSVQSGFINAESERLARKEIKSLNLMVKRGHEVDVEYSRKFLIDRINSFLGYEFINKIKLVTLKKKEE